MQTYKVRKLNIVPNIVVDVPGSKSITNRALLIAALASGTTVLKGTLFSDDSRYFISSLQTLGFNVSVDEEKKIVTVKGCGGVIPYDNKTIYVGSAGTAARFLTAMLGLSGGSYTIDASAQMKKRPMEPLFKALEELGVDIEYIEEPYFLPVKINGRKELDVNEINMNISKSTQFLSAFLLTGLMNKGGLIIHINGERKTGSYIDITRGMMREFGLESEFDGNSYFIKENSSYNPMEYQIEPDVSGACYFYAMAAITGGKTLVNNVHFNVAQGDVKFLSVLKNMGCSVEDTNEGIVVVGPDYANGGVLRGIDIDMKDFSDQALTLAAISVFADSPTTIRNIGHIRVQESDRLSVIATELNKLGIKTDEKEDMITIYPGKITPTSIDTYDDHRVAMAFTLIGLKCEGIVINDPMCCKKTFENYFTIIDDISSL